MRLYFSGIGGVGIGPLAEIAADAGYEVMGSDQSNSLMTEQLSARGVEIDLDQTGKFLSEQHQDHPIDWFIYTSALSHDHPELQKARELGIRSSKRDEFLAEFIKSKDLKLIAIAGTHGKTTTTGLMIWTLQQLGIPTSHSIGTTIAFAASGKFEPNSDYFIYECDEYDRNFLHFESHLSLITALEHDHVDTYPEVDDYRTAFVEFLEKSDSAIMWQKDFRFLETDPRADLEIYDHNMDLSDYKLAGLHVRQNAFLVYQAIKKLMTESDASQTHSLTSFEGSKSEVQPDSSQTNRSETLPTNERERRESGLDAEIIKTISSFPGTDRRFEKLADNLYTDYGHHPAEIAATLQLAKEISDQVVLVYQPHQNMRQHEVRHLYTDCMELANEVYWLPTYLSREDPELDILTPQQLSQNISNESVIHYAELDDDLWINIQRHLRADRLVLVMGAGDIDTWLRRQLRHSS